MPARQDAVVPFFVGNPAQTQAQPRDGGAGHKLSPPLPTEFVVNPKGLRRGFNELEDKCLTHGDYFPQPGRLHFWTFIFLLFNQ
jgi:hypothetical protein